jgi:hypothetical protein
MQRTGRAQRGSGTKRESAVESEVAGREALEAANEVKSRMEAALYEIMRVIASWCFGPYRSISVHAGGSLRDAENGDYRMWFGLKEGSPSIEGITFEEISS